MMQRLAWNREGPRGVLPRAGAGAWLSSPLFQGRRRQDSGLLLHAGLPSCRLGQLGRWLCRAGAELGRMQGEAPGACRGRVGLWQREATLGCELQAGGLTLSQNLLGVGAGTVCTWECTRVCVHTQHASACGRDPAPRCCCVLSPPALLVLATCRLGLNPARPAPPSQQRVAEAAQGSESSVHVCTRVCTEFCVCAGRCARRAATHPLNQREKVPYLHMTVHIRVQEHAVTRTRRGQPRGGTRERFMGCACFSAAHRVYLPGVCLRGHGGDAVVLAPACPCCMGQELGGQRVWVSGAGRCRDGAVGAARSASTTPPASVCPRREDGASAAWCQAVFLHKQGFSGPIGA